jgi:glycine cleavage system P protein (glycine dehydrogenase)
MITNNFKKRHNGPKDNEVKEMLQAIGFNSLDELIENTVPSSIRKKKDLELEKPMNEYEYSNHIKEISQKNKLFKSFIGLGFYHSILPAVIQRNVLENPGWYTSYTPYQAEISQGRLEALLNFQTMISDLTALPIANASLLDEASAAAEAMIMSFNARSRAAVKTGAKKYFVSDKLFPQNIDVLITRAKSLDIELVIGDYQTFEFDEFTFGAVIQYPDEKGNINNYKEFVEKAHKNIAVVAVAADIMSLALIQAPGEWGADIAFGSTQRFGIPMGYGGPHAAYFATKEEYKRNIPGRIIGISVDAQGNRALRMALQTREQHIKRERATSNICTAQALLAIMASMYAVYHGQNGIKEIARDINVLAGVLNQEIQKYGYKQLNENFFDTLNIELTDNVDIKNIEAEALKYKMNFRYIDNKHIGISIDETTTLEHINQILEIFANANNQKFQKYVCEKEICQSIKTYSDNFQRTSQYLSNEVFNTYHSETEMMRYLKILENKDLSLNRSMIPLGSCTMKLNAVSELMAISWPEFGEIHPFVPQNQALGYKELIENLEKDLCEVTGFDAISFQPNSGAAGEYTGLNTIKLYQKSQGEGHRNICLIPSSAHGTNPASSVMAGMKVVVVNCDENGNIDLADMKGKAEQHKDNLAATMITYPSTHGVFEENIIDIIKVVHDNGGQVYLDGANMNAQVGLTNPGILGADVCHLNLHKTFAIPHGGGGPGVGPIGTAKHLTPFLPSHRNIELKDNNYNAVAAAPYGSAMVLPISYGYVKMMGGEGLTEATKYAILNANYIRAKLEKHYKILYTGAKGQVAHEMIVDCNEFSKSAHIEAIDIAKRLMDYGFHAPTVAFPVHGTLMVEPTESEPLSELDRFINAMISIREEIRDIEERKVSFEDNIIKNAPHTLDLVTKDQWNKNYSRQEAAFPCKNMSISQKYWPSVGKIDDAYGDRNLVCSCEPIEEYA